MQDAGTRMSRYLVTQLIVNVAFGSDRRFRAPRDRYSQPHSSGAP